jgi:hypothetical protein
LHSSSAESCGCVGRINMLLHPKLTTQQSAPCGCCTSCYDICILYRMPCRCGKQHRRCWEAVQAVPALGCCGFVYETCTGLPQNGKVASVVVTYSIQRHHVFTHGTSVDAPQGTFRAHLLSASCGTATSCAKLQNTTPRCPTRFGYSTCMPLLINNMQARCT